MNPSVLIVVAHWHSRRIRTVQGGLFPPWLAAGLLPAIAILMAAETQHKRIDEFLFLYRLHYTRDYASLVAPFVYLLVWAIFRPTAWRNTGLGSDWLQTFGIALGMAFVNFSVVFGSCYCSVFGKIN